jgi:ribosomal protein L37AE/L43A
MGLLGTIAETLRSSSCPSYPRNGRAGSTGAYWCHDCDERVLDLDVDGDAAPDCPSCGEAMTFERSPDSAGCAC